MRQLALFEDFAVPPVSRRVEIQRRAALRREEEDRAKDRRRFDRAAAAKEKLIGGEATCCLGWYPRRAGWTRCVTCQKPLSYS